MKNEFIRLARFKLGDLTQEQLADQLSINKMTVHLAETGKNEAKPWLLMSIECLLRRADKWPILHLDVKVTEDFINGKVSSNGPTRSTGTHLFLNDLLIAHRDSDGQVYAVRKGMNAEAESILRGSGDLKE